jgi:inactivated superfamily I helicase
MANSCKLTASILEAMQISDCAERQVTEAQAPLDGQHILQAADICRYIEDMAQALKGLALDADQEMLADLLGAAASEARSQANRARYRH